MSVYIQGLKTLVNQMTRRALLSIYEATGWVLPGPNSKLHKTTSSGDICHMTEKLFTKVTVGGKGNCTPVSATHVLWKVWGILSRNTCLSLGRSTLFCALFKMDNWNRDIADKLFMFFRRICLQTIWRHAVGSVLSEIQYDVWSGKS